MLKLADGTPLVGDYGWSDVAQIEVLRRPGRTRLETRAGLDAPEQRGS